MKCQSCYFLNLPNDTACGKCGAPLMDGAWWTIGEGDGFYKQQAALGGPLLPVSAKSFWHWTRVVLMFPVKAAAVILLLSSVFGSFFMWNLPNVARNNDLDLFFVSVRVLKEDQAARPLAHLGYSKPIQDKMVDLVPEYDTGWEIASFVSGMVVHPMTEERTTTKKPDGSYEHVLKFMPNAGSRTEVSLTPHLNVTEAEIDQAYKHLLQIFKDPKERLQVKEWGAALFWSEWIVKNPLDDLRLSRVPEPLDGTTGERLWIVWQVLRGEGKEADEDLHRLPELFQQAFPDPAHQKTALAWASRVYEQMETDYQRYQVLLKPDPDPILREKTGKVEKAETLISFKQVLPPKTDWTYMWIVYRYVGLNEASRKTAKEHWLSMFPEDEADRVQEMGAAILEERQSAGDLLPPVPEMLPLVCMVERLSGTDPYGAKCRETVATYYSVEELKNLRMTLFSIYPNDELFYLIAVQDPFGMNPQAAGEPSLVQRSKSLVSIGFFVMMVGLGLACTFRFLGRFLIRTETAKALWEKYRQGHSKEPLWLSGIAVVIFSLVGALLAESSLPEYVALQIRSPLEVLVASLAAMVVGGFLIGTCRRILAIYFIAFGVDLESTWADEIAGILLGGFVLFHFGNGLLAIALFALSDLLPVIVHRLLLRKRVAAPEPQFQMV